MHMRTAVTITGYNPFLNAASAKLLSAAETRFGVQRGVSGLSELVESEISWRFTIREWRNDTVVFVDKVSEAATSTVPYEAYGLPRAIPGHYDDWRCISTGLADNLARAEWLVSTVLESSYFFCERLARTTGKLSRLSRNAIWPDIYSYPTSGSRALERNLMSRFKASNYSNLDLTPIASSIARLINYRGSRAHVGHLYAHVELEAGLICYQDQSLWADQQPTVRFTSAELNDCLNALWCFC